MGLQRTEVGKTFRPIHDRGLGVAHRESFGKLEVFVRRMLR